ncbi:hypothetical protein GCM10025857_54510 [Alicyclobacillus contaminans]|nr:hypothetical protein GCM10025857_54510 [Alicyclobacillus contaminans]
MSALYDSKSKTLDDRGIKELLNSRAKYQSWLDVEAALARAQGELAVIPEEEAKKLFNKLR